MRLSLLKDTKLVVVDVELMNEIVTHPWLRTIMLVVDVFVAMKRLKNDALRIDTSSDGILSNVNASVTMIRPVHQELASTTTHVGVNKMKSSIEVELE